MYFIILSFIGLSSLLVWYFLSHDHGRKMPVEALWVAFGFGVIALIMAALVEGKVLPKLSLEATLNASVAEKLLIVIGVGIIEEAAKFVPLALFIYRKPYFQQHTDGVIYFAICGLTFGLGENILYTVTMGSKVGLVRLVITPVLHAATTGILGYYLVSAKIEHHFGKRFFTALMLLPLMHTIYDFGLFSQVPQLIVLSLMITCLLTMGLFLYFMSANDLDNTALVKIATSTAKYCSNCGKPNLDHTVFCEYCGHHL